MRNLGFTLIELMVVVAIMSILATLALPSYQDRVIKAQVGEGIALAEVVKQASAEYYAKYSALPKDNASVGLPAAQKIIGNYVSAIAVENGAVNITLGNRVNKHAAGKILTLRPAIVADAKIVPIAWVCGYASVPQGMDVKGKNITTVLEYHLPLDCLN